MVTIVWYLPSSTAEIVFTIVSIFFSCMVFGYSINTIGMILQKIELKNKKYKDETYLVNRFLKRNKIPENLKC